MNRQEKIQSIFLASGGRELLFPQNHRQLCGAL